MHLFQAKHELWLHLLFSSFAIKDTRIKEKLYELSQISFRHLKWIAKSYRSDNIYYNYKRNPIAIKHDDVFKTLESLKAHIIAIESHYGEGELFFRIREDERYFLSVIESYLNDLTCNAPITAFNKNLKYQNRELGHQQRDALILFLFEETYKEYELILIYFYMQNYTDSLLQFDVYQDLVDESHFHLKSFGNMLAELGLLAIPREVHEMSYKITDLNAFILNGIDEELNAKEECRKLAEAVEDPELETFFNFINYQENYHIELMKKLL
ncbi:MAG: iron-binding protein [Campylobacterota bacterium]|nr:iron-binding protein [Campylobacterota bacterium]